MLIAKYEMGRKSLHIFRFADCSPPEQGENSQGGNVRGGKGKGRSHISIPLSVFFSQYYVEFIQLLLTGNDNIDIGDEKSWPFIISSFQLLIWPQVHSIIWFWLSGLYKWKQMFRPILIIYIVDSIGAQWCEKHMVHKQKDSCFDKINIYIAILTNCYSSLMCMKGFVVVISSSDFYLSLYFHSFTFKVSSKLLENILFLFILHLVVKFIVFDFAMRKYIFSFLWGHKRLSIFSLTASRMCLLLTEEWNKHGI